MGDYEIRVQFHTYSNPTSGCQDCTISTGEVTCCDAALNLLTCRDDDQCDNIFIVCLRELGLSGNVGAESLCTTAPRITETLPDSDNIDFGSEELANFTSTMLFQEAGAWEVRMHMSIIYYMNRPSLDIIIYKLCTYRGCRCTLLFWMMMVFLAKASPIA